MGRGEAINRFGREVSPFECHDVDAARMGGNSFGQHVRRYIVQCATEPGQETIAAYGDKVMHCTTTRDGRIILHMNMTSKQSAVGDDNIVAELAIVGNVHVSHQEVVVADAGDPVFFDGAPIDGYTFAEGIPVAYLNASVSTGVTDILRFGSQDNVGIEQIISANGDVSHDGDIVEQTRATANLRT